MSQFRVTVGDWRVTDRERQLVNQVLDSGRLSYGPVSRRFERGFAKTHGCFYGVLSNSGTSSLQVSLQAMKELHGWEDGDEVIVPAVTFVATANVVLHNRLTPVLADVDPLTYNIDTLDMVEKITPRTRAIIPVHLFGQPAFMRMIVDAVVMQDIRIIEDSCETMFATHHGQPVGSWGDIGCFSTYMAHLITTGVGGISTTDNPEYAVKMRSLVNHGRDSIYLDTDTESTKEVIERRFRFTSVGHSFRVTELEAALGLAQLECHESMIEKRQRNARYLIRALDWLEVAEKAQLPTIWPDDNTHSFMMFPIVLLSGNKAEFANHLESHGIETRDMLPLTNQPVYKGMWDPEDYPVAEWINKNGLYIGCHQYLEREDLAYTVQVIEDYF